jgi:hypothetical protein
MLAPETWDGTKSREMGYRNWVTKNGNTKQTSGSVQFAKIASANLQKTANIALLSRQTTM